MLQATVWYRLILTPGHLLQCPPLGSKLKKARDTVEKTISTFILALEKAGVKKEQIKADSFILSPTL